MQVIGELTTYLIELNIDRQWFDIILEFLLMFGMLVII